MTTKMNDFDEGVLILEPSFSGNVIFNPFVSKVTFEVRNSFEYSSPDCNAAKLHNECFSFFMLASLKARADTWPLLPQNGKISVRKLWLLSIEPQILKMTLPFQKKQPYQNVPSSKLDNWKLHGRRILYAIMHITFSFCPSFSWNYCISAAFFLGHPE